MNKTNNQKGRLPFRKFKFFTENEISLITKKAMRFTEELRTNISNNLNLGKKYFTYKRDGTRLGGGKSKKHGIVYRINSNEKLMSYKIQDLLFIKDALKEKENINIYLNRLRNLTKMDSRLKFLRK